LKQHWIHAEFYMRQLLGSTFTGNAEIIHSGRKPTRSHGSKTRTSGALRPSGLSFTARAHVMKADQVNVPAPTVVGHLQEIDNPKKSRLLRQLGSNVRKTNRLDGVHFDLAFFHPVPSAYPHVRTCPDADTAGDFSTTNAIPQALGKHHR
jgi:hypothetical protein